MAQPSNTEVLSADAQKSAEFAEKLLALIDAKEATFPDAGVTQDHVLLLTTGVYLANTAGAPKTGLSILTRALARPLDWAHSQRLRVNDVSKELGKVAGLTDALTEAGDTETRDAVMRWAGFGRPRIAETFSEFMNKVPANPSRQATQGRINTLIYEITNVPQQDIIDGLTADSGAAMRLRITLGAERSQLPARIATVVEQQAERVNEVAQRLEGFISTAVVNSHSPAITRESARDSFEFEFGQDAELLGQAAKQLKEEIRLGESDVTYGQLRSLGTVLAQSESTQALSDALLAERSASADSLA